MLSERIQRIEWALMVVIIFGSGAIAQAQNQSAEDNQEEGQIIQIGPDRGNQSDREPRRGDRGGDRGGGRQMVQPGFPEEAPRPASAYWVGLIGGPVGPALRHHIDLPEGVGLQVLEVAPDGPAGEAGLQQYDIMVRAGDTPLDEMRDLVEIVAAEGEREGQIALEVVRGVNTETIWITPVLRPAGAGFHQHRHRQGHEGRLGEPRGLQDLLGGILGNRPEAGFDFRNDFRNFGQGFFLEGQQQQMSIQQLPDGTSVKVEKRSGQPTKITVERGNEAWEVEGDDPVALDQLPDNVRPYVEQMLGQEQLPGRRITTPAPHLPQFLPQAPQRGDMNERLKQMEQQMRELRERLSAPNGRDRMHGDGDVQ